MEKEQVKALLTEYVKAISTPAKEPKGWYVCPLCGSGSGTHKTSALHITGNVWQCHSCAKGGDIFSMAAEVNKLDVKADFPKVLQAIADTLHITIDRGQSMNRTQEQGQAGPAAAASSRAAALVDYTAFVDSCAANGGEYFYKRGLTIGTIERYKLGSITQETLNRYKESCKLGGGFRVGDAIIPYLGEAGKVVYFIARDTTTPPNSGRGQYPKFKKPKQENAGKEPPFNAVELEKEGGPLFITEAQLDALSIIDAGGAAVALGGTGADKLLEVLPKNFNREVIIATDNDQAGEKSQKNIAAALHSRGITFKKYAHRVDCKDINQELLKDKAGLVRKIREYNKQYESEQLQARANTLPATELVQSLLDKIKDTKKNGSISTGIASIDRLLQGGFRAGLYFIGAISSLGKTSLILQLADNMAAGGQDVLFFSLEMSRYELMARSMSRRSFMYTKEKWPLSFFKEGRPVVPQPALTTTDILQGRVNSTTRQESFQAAVNGYAENEGKHLYIYEGVGNVDAKTIRRVILEHKERQGVFPLVVIDYIQLLAVADTSSAGTKDKIDQAVLELKRISRDYDIPIIGISSINRNNYKQPIDMSAFKESGAVEYTADVLIGLQYHGMDYEDGEGEDEKNTGRGKRIKDIKEKNKELSAAGQPIEIDFKVLKNRNGARKDCTLKFTAMFNYFEDVERLKTKGQQQQKQGGRIF